MSWSDVVRIIISAISAAGGIGALLFLVVKACAKFISDIVLKEYDAQLQKEIESYKHDLEIEAEKYRTKTENITYVTQKQFDTEFEAYQSLFAAMFDFTQYTACLYPRLVSEPIDPDERRDERTMKYDRFVTAYNDYTRVLEINAPFIPEENYKLLDSLRQQAYEISVMYPEIKIQDDPAFKEDHSKLARENTKKTEQFVSDVDKAKGVIRNYLSTLKVIP